MRLTGWQGDLVSPRYAETALAGELRTHRGRGRGRAGDGGGGPPDGMLVFDRELVGFTLSSLSSAPLLPGLPQTLVGVRKTSRNFARVSEAVNRRTSLDF